MNDVMHGHVSLMFVGLSIVKGSVDAGKLHDRLLKRPAQQEISRRAYGLRVGRAGL